MNWFINLVKNEALIYSIMIKVTQMTSGLIIMKLLSSHLSKSEFGYYALMMALLGLISMLPFAALDHGVLRFTVEYRKRISHFFSNVVGMYLFFILLYSTAILLSHLFFNYESKLALLLLLIPFLILPSILFNLLTWFENALENQKKFAFMLFLDFVLKVGGIGILILFNLLSTESIMILFMLSYALIFLFASKDIFKFKMLEKEEMKKIFFKILPYAYPIMIWGVFVWAQGMVYRWYLEFFSSKEDVASFAIISALAILPVTALTGILGTYLLPKLFRRNENELDDKSKIFKQVLKALFYVLGILTAMWLFINIFQKEIVSILTDAKYASESWMLPYMFLAMMVYAIGNILAYMIYVKKETKDLLLANILPGLFALTVGYYLIKTYALNGALITFCCTYVLTGTLNTFIVLKNQRKVQHAE
ncbi:MAG: Polysaccharide biosynthesis family protein [uncultured Sulfurovum sp.]|uniref:Polysaccharide biosynthesis family protein n=1 Tax=uncultured Sulfurovum sp. TaxID=269237 RepID=A0A6S6SSJ7_9BACT|nr:MAG: Polysaccharide biosynthesis family protein [uncultured Sulfurovum sp.]